MKLYERLDPKTKEALLALLKPVVDQQTPPVITAK